MRSAVGKIYYTLNGADPRASGGTVADGAQLYKGPLMLKEDAVLVARALEGNRWSWPVKAKFVIAPTSGK